MIVLRNIQLSYSKPIIKRANLNVPKGEILGLVGKSGAGKSSLLKIIAGIIDPNEGDVYLAQKKTTACSPAIDPRFRTRGDGQSRF